MATRTEAARLLVYAAAARFDADPSDPGITRASAMAKLFATETAQVVVDDAIQIHGAAGLQRGHLLEALYREVRAPEDLRRDQRDPTRGHRPRPVPLSAVSRVR